MNRQTILPVLIAALAPLLAGCPPPAYGLTREYELSRLPGIDCARAEIEKIAGKTQYGTGGGEEDIFGVPTERYHHFFYGEDPVHRSFAYLALIVQHGGRAFYRNWLQTLDEKAAQPAAMAARPTMIALEDALTRHCRMVVMPGTFAEECSGFSCSVFSATPH